MKSLHHHTPPANSKTIFRSSFDPTSFKLFLSEIGADQTDDFVDDDGGYTLLQWIITEYSEWAEAKSTIYLTVPWPEFKQQPVAEIRLGENGDVKVSFVENGGGTSSNAPVVAETFMEEDPPVAEIKVEVCRPVVMEVMDELS